MKLVPIRSAWGLWRKTLKRYREGFKLYTLLVLALIIPITLFSGLAPSDSTVSAYASLMTIFMNVALIYAISRPELKPHPKLRSIYYESSSVIVRYMVVGTLLAIMLIPAALGIAFASLGGGIGGVPLSETLLLGAVGLIIGLPSIYLLVSNGLGIITVFGSDRWPLESLRVSRNLVRGRFLSTLGRYIVLAIGLFAFAVPIAFVMIGLYALTRWPMLLGLYQIVNVMVILPLLYLYLHEMVKALEESR